MKYLCLIYDDENTMATMSQAGRRGVHGRLSAPSPTTSSRQRPLCRRARRCSRPQPPRRFAVRNGKVSTTDGPFAETKEQLGGFYLIEAKDLNEAIQVASRIPSALHRIDRSAAVMNFGG